MKNKKLALVLAGLLCVAPLASCGKKPKPQEEKKTQQETKVSEDAGVLKVGELWGIKSIDPAKDGTLVHEKMMVTDTLLGINPDFTLKPGLAEKWEKVNDTTYDFTIRKGVKFHNGKEMTAEDIKWALEETGKKNPKSKRLLDAKEIKVLEPTKLRIETNNVNGDMIETLAYSGFGIYSKDSEVRDNVVVKPIGTGPLKVVNFDESKQEVELEKFNDYWGDYKGNMKKVIFRSVGDANTRALSVEKGELNFTVDPPFNQFKKLEANKEIKIQKQRTPRNYILQLNHNKPYMKQLAFRQALSLGVDRESILNNVLFGVGGIPKGLFSEDISWTRKDAKAWEYNKEKAMKNIESLGYKKNAEGIYEKDGKPLALKLLTFPTRPGLPIIAQALQQNYKEIGINLDISVNEYAVMTEMSKKGDFDMLLMPFAVSMIPSPSYYLDTVLHSENNKTTGFKDEKIDGLIKKLKATADKKAKQDIADQIQLYAEENLPIITLLNYGTAFLMRDNVSNYKYNPIAHDYMLNTEIDIK